MAIQAYISIRLHLLIEKTVGRLSLNKALESDTWLSSRMGFYILNCIRLKKTFFDMVDESLLKTAAG